MTETAIVVVIVLAAAYFSLRSVFRPVTGKKTCYGNDKCGSCNLAESKSDAGRGKIQLDDCGSK